MAIRFYMNGTEGATDGTEISNGDLTNPLVVDGFYPAAGITVSKTVTLMVRADAGETWKGVIIAVVSSTTDERSKFNISGIKEILTVINQSGHRLTPFYPSVSNVNQALTLTVSASGNESNSPDTTQKLMMIGGVQVGS